MTARQRVVAGTTATLRWQAVDQDGEPSDPGTTTAGVTASDGSTVLAAGTATTADGDARTVEIDPQEVDQLTVTWTGATASGVTTVDVVGGVYFTVDELRVAERTVSAENLHSPAAVIAARIQMETLFEQRTRQAFVPRFAVLTTNRQCRAERTMIREVRWVELTDGTIVNDADTIDALVEVGRSGAFCSPTVHRLGVVYGYDQPPPDLLRKAMLYTRHLLTDTTTGIDMRVLQQSSPDGFVQRYATPGQGRWITGIPDIDEVLFAYRERQLPRSIRPGVVR